MQTKIITVNDKMQTNYIYECTETMGKNFERFHPDLSPAQMLEAGVFWGKYMTDCQNEFPADRFTNAKLSPLKKNPKLNFFGVNASMSLRDWKKKWRIYADDPRGRFQWYCRYYMGRRIPDEDNRQIKRRWNMRRHTMAIMKNCHPMDWDCRKRQRQAVLHWGYDSRKM